MPRGRGRATTKSKGACSPKEAKKSISIFATVSLIERFDAYVKSNGLKSRAEGLRLLLDSVESAATPSSSSCSPGVRGRLKSPNGATVEEKWSESEIDNLRRALDACKPATDDQWRTIAHSIGGAHTWQQYKRYAETKLRYRAKKAVAPRPKRTLRVRQEKDRILREQFRDYSEGNNDLFKDAPELISRKIAPLIDVVDVSCLNTPASGISYSSRFDLDQSSGCPTPSASFGNEDLKKDVGSEARKRANRCINRMEPILSKALTMTGNAVTPKGRVNRVVKRHRASNDISWTRLRRRHGSSSVGEDTDEDVYFSENA